jgi:hypothetical protein
MPASRAKVGAYLHDSDSGSQLHASRPRMALRFDILLTHNRRTAIVLALLLTACIAVADWVVVPHVSTELLYLFPILIAAGHLERSSIAVFALLCDVLREQLGQGQWGPDLLSRFAMS